MFLFKPELADADDDEADDDYSMYIREVSGWQIMLLHHKSVEIPDCDLLFCFVFD